MAETAAALPGSRHSGVLTALARQALRDARTRTVVFAYLFAVYAYIQPVGYRHTYSTDASRRAFAESFAGNPGLRLLYGQPHLIDTTAGYTAWRVGGVLAIAAAAYGLLAAVRAGRAEEESGRTEVVLAAPVSRATANTAGVLAIAAGIALLWVAEFVGLVAARIPTGGAAYFALATTTTAAVFTGIGAVASQLVPTRRGALGIGAAALGALFLLRILADTVSGAGWLRWATPLGWAELLRPLSDPAPLVLLLPVMTTALLLAVAAGLARRRDIGAGLLPRRDSSDPHLWLLSSPTAQALRGQSRVIVAWLAATGGFMMILGVVSHSLSAADVPANVQRQIAKLGSGSIVTPTGYIAFLFLFVALALCLFVCTQISALRQDEEQHLESVLAQPVARSSWLAGRLVLTAFAAVAIALAAGFAAWVGARAAGVPVPLPSLLEAGANALPIAILFLGLGGLVYALAPRVAAGLLYGLVAVAFLWQLVGALLGPPHWVLDLSPFAHLALVPSQPFRPVSAAAMVIIGLVGAVGALVAFSHRDIAGQ